VSTQTEINKVVMAEHSARRPRKVLHVLNNAGGGAALSTLALIKTLRDEGIEACAVCHDDGSAAERAALDEAVRGQVRYTPLYWWNKKIRTPRWKRPLSELKQLIRTGWTRQSSAVVADFAASHGCDLIHTNTLTTPEGGMVAKRLGLPHVWHVRELVGPGNPYRLTREGPALGHYMASHCSKLVANSESSAAPIRDWMPKGMLEIVFNGIDISRFHPTDRGARPSVVVGMVGSLTSRSKRHSLFVEAAALVDRNLQIEWRIYGHDPSHGGTVRGDAYVDQLHDQIARLGMTRRFCWPEFVADPVQIMEQIDILVHPAENESFGRVVVEAMAAGLPAVGARGGGVAEIIRDGQTGFLATPGDPRDLAARIEQLARDPELRRTLGRNGRQRAEQEYSQEACTAGILRVYEQAMDRPLGRAATAGHEPASMTR
jgi:glycosyltransferase involved in cell wall biosynthesis